MRFIKALIFLLLLLLFWIPFTSVRAVPVLPSSFYGVVTLNQTGVPNGTLVEALIGGQVQASGYTQIYQGSSVYSLDVRGDDTETAAQDGGRENDPVHFRVGGVLAVEAGHWHSGTNAALDLTVLSSQPLDRPQPTRTPIPTQTAVSPAGPTFTRQPAVTLFPTEGLTPAPATSAIVSPTLNAASPANPVTVRSQSPSPTGATAALAFGSAPTSQPFAAQPASSSPHPAPPGQTRSLFPLAVSVLAVAAIYGGVRKWTHR